MRPVPPDPVSFEGFYIATIETTLAMAYRVAGDREIARDATQDAYVVMVERWGQRRTRAQQDNQRYVIGIAIKKVADWYRRNKGTVLLSAECDRPTLHDDYEQILDELTVFKAVRHLLEHQPLGMRAVGILFFLERFEYSEIADILGITTSTVRTQVQRLRARLRPVLDRITEPAPGGEQP